MLYQCHCLLFLPSSSFPHKQTFFIKQHPHKSLNVVSIVLPMNIESFFDTENLLKINQ